MSDSNLKALGRYRLQEEIGRGMMGVVYKALDPDLGRVVALKTVRLAFAVPEEGRDVFEKRFLAEARAAAGLSHPGIVTVHDVGRDSGTGTLYIALEFLEGHTLAAATKGGAVMPWREALRVGGRVAEALHHAHKKGIVHRDIKPSNIMLQPAGDPKIMDFGIAKLPASQLTTAGEFFGTPSYMSPEQAAGDM
jgi:serine/threonine-protein kinase